MLEKHDLDLCLLQETTSPAWAQRRGLLARVRAYERHSWGSAVFATAGRLNKLLLPDQHAGWLVAAEVELPDRPPLVAVSVHARILDGWVRPNLDRAFEAIEPLLEGRSYVVGGDFNFSRNYEQVCGSTHHAEFLDGLEKRGFVNCHRKFHDEEQQTFWGPKTRNAYQDDHVFASPDLAAFVTSCDVADRTGVEYLSDHSVLVLELTRAVVATVGQRGS